MCPFLRGLKPLCGLFGGTFLRQPVSCDSPSSELLDPGEAQSLRYFTPLSVLQVVPPLMGCQAWPNAQRSRAV
jgi:hypothetical protein